MKQRLGYFSAAAAVFLMSGAARAQITPAEGYTPPDDTPTVKVGGTIFADYTWQAEPKAVDADGNTYHPNAFNVTRAYINVTGSISHLISFRITPDVVRTGPVNVSGTPVDVPGITGTLTYRLKYAYGQLNLDDLAHTDVRAMAQWQGTWFRLGMQQTPYIDFEENIYRYRFAGTVFVDREGFLSSSDLGFSFHWNAPENYGDMHIGAYNGEGYTRPEVNDQKAFMIRATLRPVPQIAALRGLRLTAFYDSDHYVRDAKRERLIGFISYESPWVNFGGQYVKAKDQTSVTKALVEAEGWSVWATPRIPNCGIEALIRWDRLAPNNDLAPRRQRLIAGPAYWFPVQKGVAAAVMLKFEQLRYMGAPNQKPTEESYGLFTLFNF
jgi:hypothetical protein